MNDQSPPSRSRAEYSRTPYGMSRGWEDDRCAGSYRSLMVAINVIDHDSHAMGTSADGEFRRQSVGLKGSCHWRTCFSLSSCVVLCVIHFISGSRATT